MYARGWGTYCCFNTTPFSLRWLSSHATVMHSLSPLIILPKYPVMSFWFESYLIHQTNYGVCLSWFSRSVERNFGYIIILHTFPPTPKQLHNHAQIVICEFVCFRSPASKNSCEKAFLVQHLIAEQSRTHAVAPSICASCLLLKPPLSLSRFDGVIKATVQQISPGTSNKNPINMGLSFYLFHLFLAVYPHLLEAADCSCNGYITPRGQGECKTTYKVVRSMSESCVDNSAEGSRIKKHLDLWEERKISSTFAGRHLLLCWRGRVQRSVASKVPVSRYY